MKKLYRTTLLLIPTLLLSGCGTNQNKGFSLWKEKLDSAYAFEYCKYANVNKEQSTYYCACYHDKNDVRNKLFDYFKFVWTEDDISTITEDEYTVSYASVKSKELDGKLGQYN